MFGLDEKIVVYDTEYTTWEGAADRDWSGPGEYREIVEIGAVIVETAEFRELASKTIYIRPVKNPMLSQYFIDLTGVTQKKVDTEGTTLLEAYKEFGEWAKDLSMYCWGTDEAVMKENAALIGVPFAFDSNRFKNIRAVFEGEGVSTQEYKSSTIPDAFGVSTGFRAHDALNDARSIVVGLRALKEKCQKENK